MGIFIISLSLFSFLGSVELGFAKGPDWSKYDGKVKIGFEIELLEGPLANLVRFFDFEKLQTNVQKENPSFTLAEEYLDDYIHSEEAFEALPADVKAELTHGLELSHSLVLRPSKKREGKELPPLDSAQAPERSLLGPDGKSISSTTKAELILPKSETTPIVPKLKTPKQEARPLNEWPLLYARWNGLPAERKRALVRWEHLSDRLKARLLLSFEREISSPNLISKIQLKKIAPEWLRRMEWNGSGIWMPWNFGIHKKSLSIL